MDGAEASPEDLLSSLDWIRGLVRSLIADPGTAEDVAQEAWLLAAEKPQASRAWIAVVARNLVRQHGRSEGSRARREQSVAQREAQASTADLVLRTERQALVVQAVTELPEPYRTVIIMRFVDGLKPAQIASRTGVAAGTIRSQLKRALDRLRVDLDAQFGSREAWGLALLPLAKPPLAAKAALGSAGMVVTTGWMMKKTIALVLVCLAVAAGTYSLLRQEKSPLDQPIAEVADIVAPGGVAKAPVGSSLTSGQEDRGRSAALDPASGPATAPLPTPAPPVAGWWLTGRVRVPSGVDPSQTTVKVQAEDGEAILGKGDFSSAMRVNLQSAFQHPTLLCKSFQIEIDHPDCMAQVITRSTDRAQRQGGFLAGTPIAFPIDVELNAATHGVSGRIELPDNANVTGNSPLQAALLAQSEDGWQVIDQQGVGPDRTFHLRSAEAGEFLVVAWQKWDWHALPEVRVRPAQAEVSIEGQQTGLVLTTDWGQTIEGSLSVLPSLPGIRWTVHCGLRENGKFPLHGLAFLNGHVENQSCSSIAASNGRFRVPGLGVHSYRVRVGRAVWASSDAGTNWTNSTSPAVTAAAPSTGVHLELAVQATGFEVRSSGLPLDQVHTVGGFDHGTWSKELGPDGRVLFLTAHGTPIEWFRFSRSGFDSRTIAVDSLDIEQGTWNPVELEPAKSGELLLEIEGDPERQIEEVTIQLQAIDSATDLEEAERSTRRMTDTVAFPGIPPGTYLVTALPAKPVHWSIATTLLAQTFEVEIAAGQVVTHQLSFPPGGLISLSLDGLAGQEDPRFQLYGPAGQIIEVSASVRSRGSHTRSSARLKRRGLNVFEPAQPPGLYRLELWADDLPQRTVPIEVVAGETAHVDLR